MIWGLFFHYCITIVNVVFFIFLSYWFRVFLTVILLFFCYKNTIFCIIWTLLFSDESSIFIVIGDKLFPKKIFWMIFPFLFLINSVRFWIFFNIKLLSSLPKESKISYLFSSDTLIAIYCKSYCFSTETPTFLITKCFQKVVKRYHWSKFEKCCFPIGIVKFLIVTTVRVK